MKYEEEEYCSDLLNQIKNLIYKNKSAFEVGTLDFEVLTILLEKKIWFATSNSILLEKENQMLISELGSPR